MDIIAGTAGHIDHGKTALIKALTGIDTDRLPEEKHRGITIDLGFAELEIGDIRFGFVDVPGHERFVKNMLAGVSGIDLVLLVVAADEGVMPQTREHFDICRLLGVKTGLVALTKKDLADDETLELANLQIAELVSGSFLETAPVVPVSTRTGEGLDQLRTALKAAAERTPIRNDRYIARLSIDRSFSVKGFGSVVTGTLNSGAINEGDELEIMPGAMAVRVRGLQTHGDQVAHVHAGQRTAVNLGGVDHSDVVRGMVLVQKRSLWASQVLDARVELLETAARPLRSRQRVRAHIGTAEILARISVLNDLSEIESGKSYLIQLRLESPTVVVPGERFILRSYSPPITIGGGTIIDPLAVRHRKRDILTARSTLKFLEAAIDDPVQQVEGFVGLSGEHGLSTADLQGRTGLRFEVLSQAINTNIEGGSIVNAGRMYLASKSFEELKAKAASMIEQHHRDDPLSKGISRETLREKVFAHIDPEIFKAVLVELQLAGKVTADKDILRSAAHGAQLSEEEMVVVDRLKNIYATTGLEVPKLNEALASAISETRINAVGARKLFQVLLDAGELIKATDEFYFSRRSIDAARMKLANFAAATSDRMIDVPQFKELTHVSRKYAIPLLEYFDREKITRRAGDKRLIL